MVYFVRGLSLYMLRTDTYVWLVDELLFQVIIGRNPLRCCPQKMSLEDVGH